LRYLAACHATAQFRRIICLQHHHVETFQHSVHVVIVENAIRQAIQIIQWTDCLRQFLVQAIVDFLWACVIWQENRQLPRFLRFAQFALAVRRALRYSSILEMFGTTKHAACGKAGRIPARLIAWIVPFAGALADVWLILMLASVRMRCNSFV